jgi:hypothetical protein
MGGGSQMNCSAAFNVPGREAGVLLVERRKKAVPAQERCGRRPRVAEDRLGIAWRSRRGFGMIIPSPSFAPSA